MRVSRTLFAGLLLGLFVSGCGSSSSPTAPTVPLVPFSQVDLRPGTGAEAIAGKRVTVNYTGWLYDAAQGDQKGRQFDTSVGKEPFMFVLGSGQVIRGWEQGLVGMRVGGLRRLVIPPSLAYGSAGAAGVIPPNATLVFDVEMLDVQG